MASLFAWFFLSFRGRINRQEYWLGLVLTTIVVQLLGSRLVDLSLALFEPRNRVWYRDELDFAMVLPKLLLLLVVI